MIFKLHKIPDKVFFKAIFLIIALWNLKYFFLPLQVPFTMITQDFIQKNPFYSSVYDIRKASEKITGFQDEGKIGFVSDVQQSSVFDLRESIRSFYTAQYAVIPSILKNDTQENFVIASYEKNVILPEGFSIKKRINDKVFILKNNKNDKENK